MTHRQTSAAATLLLALAVAACDRTAEPGDESSLTVVSRTVESVVSEPPGDTGLLIPVRGVLPNRLRDMFVEGRSGKRLHQAIDIMAPRGTPVVAAAHGTLLKLHTSALGGLMVYAADASDRFILMYAHLDRYAEGLVPGAPIKRGQLLGYVGFTGNASPTAPHLHFAISRGQPSVKWWKGTPINPYPLLVRGVSLSSPFVAQAEAAEAARIASIESALLRVTAPPTPTVRSASTSPKTSATQRPPRSATRAQRRSS